MTLCGGSQNLPVSINEILGWKRMRKYKPKSQAIEALKRSSFLEVMDNKRIRRRVPYAPEPHDDESNIAVLPKWKKAADKAAEEEKENSPPRVELQKSDGLKVGYEVRHGVITRIEGKKKVSKPLFIISSH